MAILTTDLQQRLSGGAGNSDPNASLGGAKSANQAGSNLFDDVPSAESSPGDVEYRCVYLHNNHGSLTLQNSVVWISVNTPSPDSSIDIGLGAAAINATETAVANENTAPAGVTFSAPANKGAGLAVGNIPAGQHKALWIRRTINAGAAAYNNDGYTIRWEGDTAA